jgi:hypothetical protein
MAETEDPDADHEIETGPVPWPGLKAGPCTWREDETVAKKQR